MKQSIKSNTNVTVKVGPIEIGLPLSITNNKASRVKMPKPFIFLWILVCVTGLSSSCKKEALDTYECLDAHDLTFDNQIAPIINLNCMTSSCHSQFDEYEYVKRFVENDELLGSIQHKEGYSPMPKNAPKLPDSLIVKISCWVQNGAPKN